MKTFACSAVSKRAPRALRKRLLRRLFWPLLTVCLAAAGGHPALAGDKDSLCDASLRPKILSGDSLDDWTVGLSYHLDYRKFGIWDVRLGEADMLLEVKLAGTLAFDSALNTEALISEALIGISLLTGQAGEDPLVPGQDPKKNLGRAADYGSRGYLYAGTDLRHETDQELEEHHLGVGVEVGYINPKDEGIWSFIPSVIVAVEWINPFESQLRDDLSLGNPGFARFRVEASLKSSIGQKLFAGTPIAPFGLRFDYRYFVSDDLDKALKADGHGEITYFAAALTYSHRGSLGPFGRQTFFVKLTDGRLPPATQDETVISLGVIVPMGKPSNTTR